MRHKLLRFPLLKSLCFILLALGCAHAQSSGNISSGTNLPDVSRSELERLRPVVLADVKAFLAQSEPKPSQNSVEEEFLRCKFTPVKLGILGRAILVEGEQETVPRTPQCSTSTCQNTDRIRASLKRQDSDLDHPAPLLSLIWFSDGRPVSAMRSTIATPSKTAHTTQPDATRNPKPRSRAPATAESSPAAVKIYRLSQTHGPKNQIRRHNLRNSFSLAIP